jgi:Flp pilus assembly pilin Flp
VGEEAHVRNLLAQFIQEECGQDLIEYAFLGVFLVLVILGGLSVIGTGLNTGMSNIASTVSNAS